MVVNILLRQACMTVAEACHSLLTFDSKALDLLVSSLRWHSSCSLFLLNVLTS